MANNYFQFKQFRIEQGQCAMKVSTEACILGAWVPSLSDARVLDIGAGTGLLSMMLAQRMEALVDAVEIDELAAVQCQENFQNSPWSSRLNLIKQNVFDFADACQVKYDLIISNPPFYTNSLKSDLKAKNKAMHDTDTFTKELFVSVIHNLLSADGAAYVLYPKTEAEEFTALARHIGLYVSEVLVIRNQPDKDVFRLILKVSKTELSYSTENLNIRNGNVYSEELNELMKDYYLKL